MYYSFALAGHRGTCLRPLHIFALLAFCFKSMSRWRYNRRRRVWQLGEMWCSFRDVDQSECTSQVTSHFTRLATRTSHFTQRTAHILAWPGKRSYSSVALVVHIQPASSLLYDISDNYLNFRVQDALINTIYAIYGYSLPTAHTDLLHKLQINSPHCMHFVFQLELGIRSCK